MFFTSMSTKEYSYMPRYELLLMINICNLINKAGVIKKQTHMDKGC